MAGGAPQGTGERPTISFRARAAESFGRDDDWKTARYLGVATLATAAEMMLQDLEARYSEAPVDQAYIRLYPKSSLGRMCAYFHEQLNRHFEFMNHKARGNRHFNADDSRALISLIDEIRETQQLLNHVGVKFEVSDYYEQLMQSCSEFLVETYGSTIPEGFPRIQLVKYEPAFLLGDTQLRIGERLDQVELKMVGEGAFAIVYKYKDPEYGVPFALKRAKQGLAEKDLARFRREFDLLKNLRFPYVLEVYRYNDDRHEYTMEYCDATLGEYVKKRNATMTFGTRKRVALQFLYGLNFVHSKGHLHRDLSYRNVLVKEYEGAAVMVKLSDFGLTKARDSELTRSESELRGTILDPTIRSFKDYNVLNEVYSVGFVLSFIFSGRKDITACSGAVRSIIDRCVAHDLVARYPDVLTIIRDVEALEPATADPISDTPA